MNLLKHARTGVLLLSMAMLPGLIWALASDKDQPIHIKSDTAEIDDAKGISIYRGKVNIDQGTINLKADQVTIYNGENGITKVIAIGNPAHYQQQQEENEPVMHAFGETIDYFVSEERIEIKKNAKLEQAQNTFTGERIDYDMKRKVVNAYSQGKNTTNNKDTRVEMVIQPKKSEPTPPATNE